MSWLDRIPEPTEAELWAIEAESEVLSAEQALFEAECAWHQRPNRDTAAEYLRSLLDLVDLYELLGDGTSQPEAA